MKCSFCGKEIIQGTGLLFVWKTGKKQYFCSGKCEKNSIKLKRKPRKKKWTSAYLKVKEIKKG